MITPLFYSPTSNVTAHNIMYLKSTSARKFEIIWQGSSIRLKPSTLDLASALIYINLKFKVGPVATPCVANVEGCGINLPCMKRFREEPVSCTVFQLSASSKPMFPLNVSY